MTIEIEKFYQSHQIDEDFDEVFYIKEYANTKDFYQPYCLANNIDDRHRLFFHWYNYGNKSNHYKNSQEKQTNDFIPKINPRNKIQEKLAILTTYFNPCNYINIKYNYIKFSEYITKFADLFTIELSFDNSFITDSRFSIHIEGEKSNILWQKEALLNILLKRIPKEYTNIAWIDSDIIFDDPYWSIHLNKQLNYYKVIQLFGDGYRENSNGQIIADSKFVSRIKHHPYGVTGFAWAIRREVIDEIKFLDNQILGGADYVMCSAFMNHPKLLDSLTYYVNDHYTQNWIQKTTKIIDSSVGYIDCSIIHMYHGEINHRNYQDRYSIFNDLKSIEKINGLWQCNDTEIADKIQKYFFSRQEDDNVVSVNQIFDQIYVLNLDRESHKYDIIKTKLDQLKIQHIRFCAIDGESLDFDGSNFITGQGDIENKYAFGCLLSHIHIIKDAKNNGYNKILILEDDVMFCDNFLARLQDIKKIKEWNLLYFGGSQHNWNNIKYFDGFYHAQNTSGTFAYGVNKSMYDEIINFCTNKTIDFNLSQLQQKYKECFVFYPNICIADVSSSSIRKPRNQQSHNLKMKWDILNYE